MTEEEEKELLELACKVSSMAFVLHSCCLYYEGLEIDTGNLVDFTEILCETSNKFFDFL